MTLGTETIEKVAKLSRLKLTTEEVDEYHNDLSKILKLVDQMSEVDTQDTRPLAHPHELFQPLRTDEVTEDNHREQFQSLAPKVESGLYLVPKVID